MDAMPYKKEKRVLCKSIGGKIAFRRAVEKKTFHILLHRVSFCFILFSSSFSDPYKGTTALWFCGGDV